MRDRHGVRVHMHAIGDEAVEGTPVGIGPREVEGRAGRERGQRGERSHGGRCVGACSERLGSEGCVVGDDCRKDGRWQWCSAEPACVVVMAVRPAEGRLLHLPRGRKGERGEGRHARCTTSRYRSA